MDVDYTDKKNVKISMVKYLKKIFAAFPEGITTSAETPAAKHLFKVTERNIAKVLPEEQTRAFHHAVAQLLFFMYEGQA